MMKSNRPGIAGDVQEMSASLTEKPFLAAFRKGGAGPPPFWLMRQAGRYLPEYRELRTHAPDFLTFCYSPDLTTEAALQPLRRFGMDAAILFSDILVVPHALGQPVAFVEGEGPRLEPVTTAADVDRLEPEALVERLAPVYQSVQRLRQVVADDVAVIGFAGAPWTLAVYMVEGKGGGDGATARLWAYAEPDQFGRLIRCLVDAIVAHLSRQIDAGAEAVQLFDSWAGLLAETQFRRWVIEPTAEIVRRLKAAYPQVPVIGFPRAAGVAYRSYVRDTGVDGVSVDATTPLGWVRGELQPQVLVQGNLDNLALVAGGPAMTAAVFAILDTLAPGPFVFNLGHGVLPQTPPDHVAALTDLVRGWRPKGSA